MSGIIKSADARLPVSYTKAREALEKCVELDECKEWFATQARAGRPPKLPGVYGFWFGGVCVYIGRSHNLHGRLTGGHHRKHEFRGCEIRWAVCANHVEVESWLIDGLRPSGNGHTAAQAGIADRARVRHAARGSVDERFNFAWLSLFGEAFP